jgi:hypothetical protein
VTYGANGPMGQAERHIAASCSHDQHSGEGSAMHEAASVSHSARHSSCSARSIVALSNSELQAGGSNDLLGARSTMDENAGSIGASQALANRRVRASSARDM